MKGLSFGYKIVFLLNNVFAILLLLSYLTAFISPKDYPIAGLLNFSIPLLWGINGFFLLLWVLKLKKQLFLSLIVMSIGLFQMKKLLVIPSQVEYADTGMKVMSYNVMQFYSTKDVKKSTFEDIQNFLKKERPDILCLQEYKDKEKFFFKDYKHKVINNDTSFLKTAIFSKYPIINTKHFDFGVSNNSAVLADVVIDKDTIRIFSVHFESLNLAQYLNETSEDANDRLIKRLEKTFRRQVTQFSVIEEDIKSSPYPVILPADMNNSALSYLYRQVVNSNLKDTFMESGEYYGKTFNFKILPIRIDMIFIDERLKSIDFKNYDVDYSDHSPVMAEIGL